MLIIAVHILFFLSFVLRILARNDLAPITRLAWFIVLLSLPFLGPAIYLLFGEINIGRATYHRAQKIACKIYELAQDLEVSALQEIPVCYQAAFQYASSINGFQTTSKNNIELMPNAQEARQRLLEDIDNAQLSVNVLYYIWFDDKTGTGVAEALIRAAKRGVECKAMADGMGSRAMVKSELWQQMRQAGVKTAIALPFSNIIHTLIFSRLDLRNHRKITIIDNRITYCGSQNCADPEFLVKSKYAPWVDIMLRVKGPVVTQNQMLFGSDWQLHQSNRESNNWDQLQEFSTPLDNIDHRGAVIAQILGDGPTERRSATPQLFASLIHLAQKELIISTPYFVPDDTVFEALCAAAYRGVNVTMIFPRHNDSWVVAAASRSYYREILNAGVSIFEFTGGLLHSKTLTIDGQIALIGSSNMDLRSFDLNYENDILIYDVAVTEAIYQRQCEYVEQSKPIPFSKVDRWPLRRRIWNNVIATLGPVL